MLYNKGKKMISKQNIDTLLRPKTLSDLHGQEVEKNIKELANAGQITHSFLLTGPSGNGKTTTARALASFLFTGQTNLEYDLENSQCYMEINASDYTGIDSMRGLLSQVQEIPFQEDKIIIVLDEAHGLSKQAQSALLKCLEEPPEHLYILLCTNLESKLETALKNRCKPFTFRTPTEEVLKRYSREFVIPRIIDSLDSHTRNQYKTNIDNLTDTTLSKIISGVEPSYRSLINAIHDYIITGAFTTNHGSVEENVKALANLLVKPNKSWRGTVSNELRSVKDFEAYRRSVCNYITATYSNVLHQLSFPNDSKYLYAISKLKNELSYSCQKADMTERIVDIILTNAGQMEFDTFNPIKK